MSVFVYARVWRGSTASGSGLLTLLALADRGDEDGVCWLATETIAADYTRMSGRQTQRILDELEDAGELYVLPRPRLSSLYCVLSGLTWPEVVEVLTRRFAKQDPDLDQTVSVICHRREKAIDQAVSAWGDKMSPSRLAWVTRCRPGVTHVSPDPSINDPLPNGRVAVDAATPAQAKSPTAQEALPGLDGGRRGKETGARAKAAPAPRTRSHATVIKAAAEDAIRLGGWIVNRTGIDGMFAELNRIDPQPTIDEAQAAVQALKQQFRKPGDTTPGTIFIRDLPGAILSVRERRRVADEKGSRGPGGVAYVEGVEVGVDLENL